MALDAHQCTGCPDDGCGTNCAWLVVEGKGVDERICSHLGGGGGGEITISYTTLAIDLHCPHLTNATYCKHTATAMELSLKQ